MMKALLRFKVLIWVIYQAGNGAGFRASADCNRDVSDPAADCFKFEQNAVAVLLNDNDHSTSQCTGSLINSTLNSNQNIRPFLLTSEHCFDNSRHRGGITNTNSMRVRFRWQTGMTIRRLEGWWPFRREVFEGHITFIGATLRASSPTKADFALLELFDTPVGNQVTYLGWNRLSVTPQNITYLHHPKGDFMKITRDADAPVQTTVANGLHLADRGWLSTLTSGSADIGVSQGGSSGSAWLNQNHQICGVHSFAAQSDDEFTICTNQTRNLKYGAGKLNECFRGDGNPETRLRDWIDPENETATLGGTFKLSAPNFIACKNIGLTVSAPNFRTSNGTAYTYRWTKSANLQLSGSGSQVVVKANATLPSRFTDFIECVIVAPASCNVDGKEVIVGRARHLFTWAANLSVRNTSTNTESTVNFVSLNRSHTFRASVEGAGSGTTYSWSVSGANGVAQFFRGQDFLDVHFFNRGSLNVSVTAQFGGCSVTKNFVIIGSGFAPQKQNVDLETTLIYPNPATAQDVIVELPRGMNLQEPVLIQLKDINGKTVRTVESKEPNILLNIENIPNGVYMVLIQTGETAITKKLTVQH